jgi:hypothetical protein
MPQDQKSIQQPKRDRRDYEQIHRRNAVGMIAQKGLSALRRWPPSPRHVFCHGGLPDIDAKLEQFAWIRAAPQSGFATLISRMSWRMSAAAFGRPPCGRDFQRQ